jgi:hypothetical protein
MTTTLYKLIIKCRWTVTRLKQKWKTKTTPTHHQRLMMMKLVVVVTMVYMNVTFVSCIYIPVQSPGSPWTILNITATFLKLPHNFILVIQC